MRNIATLEVDEIVVGYRRPVDDEAVKRLAASIKSIGLQHPISVRSVDGKWELVAGRHRLEAHRRAGLDTIQCVVVRMDDIDAEMWEISENLHRAELTALQRSEQVARWIELKKLKSDFCAERAQKDRGRPEGGVRAAARELGVAESSAREAGAIASLSKEAKEAAREAGLDDNRTALLQASKSPPEQQADAVRSIAEAKALRLEQDIRNRAAQEVANILAEYIPGDAWDTLRANLRAAEKTKIVLDAFDNLVGNPIMDRRYGE